MSDVEILEKDMPPPEAKQYVIPYTPRKHFLRLHASKKRWKFVVAHRRAGKSVAEINETIKRALQNNRKYPPPRYAYVGPSFAQTKDLIWGYAKHYTSVFGDLVKVSEGDLQLTLPNGAMINLYGGAAAYERMRGLYFDGIVLDEFPMLNPSVFSTVVRPCLADYRGWAIVSGTSNGDDHFHDLKKRAEIDNAKMLNSGQETTWDLFIIPVTETDALHPDEVIEMTKDMTPEEYAREMLCSFDAPVEGSYYGSIVNELQLKGRVRHVPYDESTVVHTWWDLGIDDATAVWFFQKCGTEYHIIRYEEYIGHSLPEIATKLKAFPYSYGMHVLPHDVKARELGTGKSRYEVLNAHLQNIIVCPSMPVEDGINAVKVVLPMCWFDAELTENGLSALKNYHRLKSGKPHHNWASHGADAFRYGAICVNMVAGYSAQNVVPFSGPLRRRVRGVR
jgi:phage terminase large subunit